MCDIIGKALLRGQMDVSLAGNKKEQCHNPLNLIPVLTGIQAHTTQ